MSIFKRLSGFKLPLLAIFALSFAIFRVMSHKPEPPQEAVVAPPSAAFEQSIAGIGIVEPRTESISVASDLPGIIRQVYVKVGEHVSKGDALFALDTREVDAQILTLKASLKSADLQAQESQAQWAMVLALKDPHAISKDERLKRQYAAELGRSSVQVLKAQLNQALTTRERLIVRAPISGQILALNARPGEFSQGGNGDPLIRLGDTDVLHVRVEIDEQNAFRVHKGAPASGSPRGNTDLKLPLKFVRFEPYVRTKVNLSAGGQRVDTRVLQVIYALESSSQALFVGQQLDVFIESPSSNER